MIPKWWNKKTKRQDSEKIIFLKDMLQIKYTSHMSILRHIHISLVLLYPYPTSVFCSEKNRTQRKLLQTCITYCANASKCNSHPIYSIHELLQVKVGEDTKYSESTTRNRLDDRHLLKILKCWKGQYIANRFNMEHMRYKHYRGRGEMRGRELHLWQLRNNDPEF